MLFPNLFGPASDEFQQVLSTHSKGDCLFAILVSFDWLLSRYIEKEEFKIENPAGIAPMGRILKDKKGPLEGMKRILTIVFGLDEEEWMTLHREAARSARYFILLKERIRSS
jgi:hypothetical protein